MGTDIEEIKSRLNIVDVLGEYIRLDKAGANWRAVCPFHNEKTPSFMVNEEKQIWHCFGCQKGGDIFGFVMEMEGIEFRETLGILADKAGVKLQSYNPQKTEEKNRTLEILEWATKFYEVQLWKGEGQKKIIEYLYSRGLNEEVAKEFRLGYAPAGWKNVLTFLIKRGYKTEEIARTGLLVKKENSNDYYDRFRDRIIFPIADYSGKILGYSARVSPGGDESQAKYVNTPETEVYHKSRVLYGLDKAKSEIKKFNEVLLVEGNMDVIASHQAGIKNTVAVSGTALTAEQIEIMKRYTRNIKMFFDMDSAGEQATKKSVKLCLSKGMSAKIVSLTQGKDAADMAKESPDKLRENVAEAKPVMEYFFQRLFNKFNKNNVEDKKKITEELLEMILILENEVEKNHWIKKLGDDLGVSELALTDELKKISLKSKVQETNKKEDVLKVEKLATKKEILIQEMIGLMLISPIAWKKVLEISGQEKFDLKDSLFDLMLDRGLKVNFDFMSFMNEIVDQRSISERAENIFSQKKYRLDLNNNIEEVAVEDPLGELDNFIRKIKIEEKKEKLKQISSDLRIAEKRGDGQVETFLCQESDKITKELQELSK